MLTNSKDSTKFGPMMKRNKKWILVAGLVLMVQSCYTIVNAPDTLPETVTQTISQPVYTSSIGSPGVYGWDPYWEPSLAYTPYYGGYGASYYSPYNYYDYHHSYYAPVYGSGGSYVSEPVAGRGFDRDATQGGSRDRQQRSETSSQSGEKGGGYSGAGGASSVAPILPNPVVSQPAPSKPIHPTNVAGSKRTRDVKPSQSGKIGSTKEIKETTTSQTTQPDKKDSSKKRVRTRK